MENEILEAAKDEENSCVVLVTSQGEEWVSCAECRVGEIACNYLKTRLSLDPCLYKKGVRLGRGLQPDPRDVVRMIQNNIASYSNMAATRAPFLKSEKELLDRFLQRETEELERAKAMMFGKPMLK